MNISRRRFLHSTATAGLLATAPTLIVPSRELFAASDGTATALRLERRILEVLGRSAEVFSIVQPGGTSGLWLGADEPFRVRLENRSGEESLVHWHGQTPPWRQDGVPSLSEPALPDGGIYNYSFERPRPGTHWIHSHLGLQEQRLMAAPLIVRDVEQEREDTQEIVVMLHDFTFRDPDEILVELRGGAGGHGAMAGETGMDHGSTDSGETMDGHAMAPATHLHDVDYDAFLANDRTLDDPEVHQVERGGRVRLRLINAAASTHFWIDLDRLEGRLVAVDGTAIVPLPGRQFEIAVAQRLDLLLDLPAEEGAWAVFAQREGDVKRTGVVLATAGGQIVRLTSDAPQAAAPVGTGLERRLRAEQQPEPRSADRVHTIRLGEAPGYAWTMNGAIHGEDLPFAVNEGERVELTFVGRTGMAHPMHLHGHHFQVLAIDGERIAGARRDTVMVPANGTVTVAFDADNPGRWALHCHHLYHMAAGMMTTVEYQG